MNSFVEIANTLAGRWSDGMWLIIWQSAALATIIYLLTLCIRRASAAVRFWLWMLVPLRLLVMPLLTISLPLLPAAAQLGNTDVKSVSAKAVVEERSAIAMPEPAPAAEESGPMSLAMPETRAPEKRALPNIWALLMAGWLSGVALCSARLLKGWRKIRRIAIGAVEASESSILASAQKAGATLGLGRVPKILVTDERVSPFLFGVLRPVLVVPAGLITNVRGEELFAVLAHEFAHLRRRDPLIGWVLAVCEALYFFHPVFYFVKRRILFERERACDNWVVAAGKARRSVYANALISAADICRGFGTKVGPVGAVAESFADLKKRLIAISRNLKPQARLSISVLVLLVILGAVCVPGVVLTARSQGESERTDVRTEGEVGNALTRDEDKSVREEHDTKIVRGLVKDKQGQPIPKAKVVLYHNYSRWGLGNRVVEETESATDGSFVFEKPLTYSSSTTYPYGRDSYVILATHPDYAFGWQNIDRAHKKPKYEIVLTEPESQTITVTDHEGNPLAGARVWPYNVGDRAGSEPIFRDYLSVPTDVGIVGGTTGADGKAVIKNLPKTRCSFHASLKGYATGLAFPMQDTIRLSKGATISGIVLDEEGNPVEGALVKFHTNWMWNFFLAKTDSQGGFHFEDLPAEGWDRSPWGKAEGADGSYKITIEHSDYIAPETQDQLQPGQVVQDFDIEACRGTLIKSHVVEIDTNRPVAGARIQGSSEGGPIDGRSDANGVFTVRVMSGQTSLFFGSPPEGVYVLRDDNPPESHLSFEAKGQEVTVTLKSPAIAGRLTSVKGKVQLPDGSPAADVEISTTNSVSYSTLTWRGPGGAYTATNSDGSFELKDVPVGLKLFLYGNTKDYQYILSEVIDNVEDPTTLSTPLVMQQGQVADILLTDKRGEPCAGLSVKTKPVMWGNQIPRADSHNGNTDAEGRLKINGIIPGMEYFIIDSRADLGESGWWDKYYNETKVLIPSKQEERKITSFEGIDIEFDPEQARGKMLLVCFWDMQQRPSRYLIGELAKREKELENKGIVVLLIHSSDVEAEELKKWVDENKITFISGRIPGEAKKVLYHWGVRAQPWLVLMDEEGIVRAGGFELEQLDEKLQEKDSAEPSSKAERVASDKIVLRLVDSEGLPVSGAKVGTNVRTRDEQVLGSNLSWSLRGNDHNISDEWGEIELIREKLFLSWWPVERKAGLYILHEGRKIGAVCDISRDEERNVIELTLEPVCHVHGKLDSEGLKKVGRPLRWTNVYMGWSKDNWGILSHSSEEQRFEFFVSPGEYELDAYGSGEGAPTKHVGPKAIVEAGQSELDMGVVDLPATKLATLIGKPAPEIGPIKAWKNGSPVKLSELKGKAVIIYFDGDSPNTSRDLPRFVELHEEFENQGLVIIALYNSASMEELEKKWVEVYEKYGGESDVPFRVAVDGGEPSFYEVSKRIRLGQTYATYDITADPTPILIDPEGKVVGELNLFQMKETIQKMLGVTIEPELAGWRQRFNKVYFLEDRQVLKRVAPPFIPERMNYYKEEESSQASLIERPPDFFTFHWDGELKRWGLGFGSGKRPLRSVLNSNLSMNQNSYEGPDELLEIDVPGDWIVRKDASEEQKLKALEEILENEIGRKIRFEKREVKRQAIIATGSFEYHRLPVTQDDRWILMFSGDLVDEDGGGGGTADSVREFLEAIGNRVNMPVIDQTEPSGQVIIPYRHYDSAYLSRIDDPAEKSEKLIQLLDNISRQTNLRFIVERRPVEMWFVTEENEEK